MTTVETPGDFSDDYAAARAIRSPRVQELIGNCDATAVGPGAVRYFTFTRRPEDSGPYHVIDLDVGERRVQVVVSPAGRNVHVAVDGEDVPPR